MPQYAKPLARLVASLEKLPGIGPKSAQRMAFHLLRCSDEEARALANAIIEVKERITLCPECFNFAESGPCEVCSDARRDRSLLCVVAEPRDLMAMERTNEFRGLYHVLQGVISPQDGVMPEMLKIRELLARVADGTVSEVILATNPTVEGDATAFYLARLLKPLGLNGEPMVPALTVSPDVTRTAAPPSVR